jgi:outer membrane protein OmpA-like peptidoglycan-associated protein
VHEPAPEPAPAPVVVKQESIELDRTVQFLPNSANLVDDSKSLLDEVAKVLESHPEVQEVQIEGYTDSRLSAQHNKQLSLQRANSVRGYLIRQGISKHRLIAKGFGADNPIADNATYEGRLQNRRVELKITKRGDAGSGGDGE